MKAELSSHAQRITSLLASDRESVRLNMLLMVVTLEVLEAVVRAAAKR